MDVSKCTALKAALAEQNEPKLVTIDRYFDGNDDSGSIGCNLMEHPGIEVFREVLTGLLNRTDVIAAYAQIAEADPGEGSWPFADKVVLFGRISTSDLSAVISPLQPTDVGIGREFRELSRLHGVRPVVVWWD